MPKKLKQNQDIDKELARAKELVEEIKERMNCINEVLTYISNDKSNND